MILSDSQLNSIILEEIEIYNNQKTISNFWYKVHENIARKSGWQDVTEEYLFWYNNQLDKKIKNKYLQESYVHVIKSNPKAKLLIENRAKAFLARISKAENSAAAALRRLEKAVAKRADPTKIKKLRDAMLKKEEELKALQAEFKAAKKSFTTAEKQAALAGEKSKKLMDAAAGNKYIDDMAKQGNIDPNNLRQLLDKGITKNIPKENLKSLQNAYRKAKAGEKIAKKEKMTIQYGRDKKQFFGDKTKDAVFKGDVNQASRHLGSDLKANISRLSGAAPTPQQLRTAAPGVFASSKKAIVDFLRKPRSAGDGIRASVGMFKSLGRKTIEVVKKNPRKAGLTTLIAMPYAALGLLIYSSSKSESDPEVPEDIANAAQQDQEGETLPDAGPQLPDDELVGPPTADTTADTTDTTSDNTSGGGTSTESSSCRNNWNSMRKVKELGSNKKAAFKKVQKLLAKAGYADIMPKTFSAGIDNPDGLCGDETVAAITKFQEDTASLEVDGIYGPKTHAAIKKESTKKAKKKKKTALDMDATFASHELAVKEFDPKRFKKALDKIKKGDHKGRFFTFKSSGKKYLGYLVPGNNEPFYYPHPLGQGVGSSLIDYKLLLLKQAGEIVIT